MADFLQDKYINVYLDYLKYEKKLSENAKKSIKEYTPDKYYERYIELLD